MDKFMWIVKLFTGWNWDSPNIVSGHSSLTIDSYNQGSSVFIVSAESKIYEFEPEALGSRPIFPIKVTVTIDTIVVFLV